MELPSHIQPPRLLLGSSSPRRKALLQEMGFRFQVVTQDAEERYPEQLQGHQITDFLCRLKADQLRSHLEPGTVLLTADTIVWQQGAVLEKPATLEEAANTLKQLSGSSHEVITSICLLSLKEQQVVHETTTVAFGLLSQEEITTYLERGNPLDKAGAYGIQEWIGMVGVERIVGSYTNVVGLPTRLVYKTLRAMAERGF